MCVAAWQAAAAEAAPPKPKRSGSSGGGEDAAAAKDKEREEEAALSPQELQKKATARSNVCKEVIATEQKYVESLHVLIAVFCDPLHIKAEKYGISPDELSALFNNVKQYCATLSLCFGLTPLFASLSTSFAESQMVVV